MDGLLIPTIYLHLSRASTGLKIDNQPDRPAGSPIAVSSWLVQKPTRKTQLHCILRLNPRFRSRIESRLATRKPSFFILHNPLPKVFERGCQLSCPSWKSTFFHLNCFALLPYSLCAAFISTVRLSPEAQHPTATAFTVWQSMYRSRYLLAHMSHYLPAGTLPYVVI